MPRVGTDNQLWAFTLPIKFSGDSHFPSSLSNCYVFFNITSTAQSPNNLVLHLETFQWEYNSGGGFMMKKALLILGIAGMLGTMGTGTTISHASTMTGAVRYYKIHKTTTIKKNYKHFKLTNHQPNSNYKAIKTFSWKTAKLKAGSKVKIDLAANQGTQYDWYRIKATTKHATHRYWVYGQALNLK